MLIFEIGMKDLRLLLLCFTGFCMGYLAQAQQDMPDTTLVFRENLEHRKELNEEFADSVLSPLTEKDRKKFTGLDFFEINPQFHVEAEFVRTPSEKPFKMQTSTDRLPEYVKYGEVHFTLMGDSFKLNIYRNLELAQRPGFEDYLFLPFADLTNGFETYGGGRYLDLRIPEGERMVLDFNKAYNPYCAYNYRYSCPIPPPENKLNIKIEAGVKDFEK